MYYILYELGIHIVLRIEYLYNTCIMRRIRDKMGIGFRVIMICILVIQITEVVAQEQHKENRPPEQQRPQQQQAQRAPQQRPQQQQAQRAPQQRPPQQRPQQQQAQKAPQQKPQQPSVQRSTQQNSKPTAQRPSAMVNRTVARPQTQVTAAKHPYPVRSVNTNQHANVYHRPYTRPPTVWQGHSYYTYNAYAYHPYRPYFYSGFRPFGFYSTILGIGALSMMINSQPYYYDDGVYYQSYNNGYQVVAPPVSATISNMPDGYSVVMVDDERYFYYAGIFYTKISNGYMVVEAPPGAVVYDLPEGATQLTASNITYLQYNNSIFQPIMVDGKPAYEVVDLDQ